MPDVRTLTSISHWGLIEEANDWMFISHETILMVIGALVDQGCTITMPDNYELGLLGWEPASNSIN